MYISSWGIQKLFPGDLSNQDKLKNFATETIPWAQYFLKRQDSVLGLLLMHPLGDNLVAAFIL